MVLYDASPLFLDVYRLVLCCNSISHSGGNLELIARGNVAIRNLGGVDSSYYTLASLLPLFAEAKVAAVVARFV